MDSRPHYCSSILHELFHQITFARVLKKKNNKKKKKIQKENYYYIMESYGMISCPAAE